ncbi:hypothetical protein H9L39_06161 [Fusarium oxysporum f. sp. albedinis]|nr:hypothetical protein H9L39_06161 [Fusarium oxysporum f. sp. albedinis]
MSLRPSSCVGNITSFPSCDSLGGILKKCNLVTGKQESIDCFCTQEVLDAYVGCEGEFRQMLAVLISQKISQPRALLSQQELWIKTPAKPLLRAATS